MMYWSFDSELTLYEHSLVLCLRVIVSAGPALAVTCYFTLTYFIGVFNNTSSTCIFFEIPWRYFTFRISKEIIFLAIFATRISLQLCALLFSLLGSSLCVSKAKKICRRSLIRIGRTVMAQRMFQKNESV